MQKCIFQISIDFIILDPSDPLRDFKKGLPSKGKIKGVCKGQAIKFLCMHTAMSGR